MTKETRGREECVDGDTGIIRESEMRSWIFRHPGRDRQAALGKLDRKRGARLLTHADRTKTLPNEGMERVQHGYDRATGLLDLASAGVGVPRQVLTPRLCPYASWIGSTTTRIHGFRIEPRSRGATWETPRTVTPKSRAHCVTRAYTDSTLSACGGE